MQQQTFNYTFDLLALHEYNPERYPFLIQSVAHGTGQARYDILFAFPGDELTLFPGNKLSSPITSDHSTFIEQFDHWWGKEKTAGAVESDLPFTGGWFVYLGYELAGEIEPSLTLPQTVSGQPVAKAVRVPAAVILDHENACIHVVSEEDIPCLNQIVRDLEQCKHEEDRNVHTSFLTEIEEENPRKYLDGVVRIKDYIVEGDVFQVNLSREWHAKLEENVQISEIYRVLREKNPAPFAGLANLGKHTIISSSPERLVEVKGDMIQTRPIAGTRPRSNETGRDQEYSKELLSHPKENAEHIMLIDLERNDLGRVCVPGSVEVNELMVLESYAHVHHIVSNVRGRLREGVTPGKVIRAVFPGGTITGCPKVRCMEIIAELEQSPRGPYTGSMGYINLDGSMDLNILIRSMVTDGKQITLRAGAGIVADSVPEHELQETRAKAKGMLLALGAHVE